MKRLFLLTMLLSASLFAVQAQVNVANLTVENQSNPEGLDVLHPRFSWQLKSSEPDLKQLSYQLQVSTSSEFESMVWNTSIIKSDCSQLIPYEGKPLISEKVYYCRVRIITNHGQTSWSTPVRWSMAFLNETEWKAKWIGYDSLTNEGETVSLKATRLSARYLRKEFVLRKPVSRAMLYICGLGSSKTYINGKSIGDDVFGTMVSWYHKHVYYKTYDITSLVVKDKNAIAVILGNGRYFNPRTVKPDNVDVFGFPKLIAQINIDYTDGSKHTLVSDSSWKLTTHGPIFANNEFDGEEYDARMEMTGWNTKDFDDSSWIPAKIVAAPTGKLAAQPNPGLSIQDEVKPVSVKDCGDGRYILDMGQNMVGWLSICNLQSKKCRPVQLRFAERMNTRGDSIYMANLRSARQTDIYIPSSNKPFSWEPIFVYHGFRYVEITGIDTVPDLKSLTGKVVYDKMQTIGKFSSSNELLNHIFHNAFWGIRGNYRGMPTDCPQRDERQGWLGDHATVCFCESYIFDNHLLYNKWMQDIEDGQRDNGVISDVSPCLWNFFNDDITYPSAYFYAAYMLYRKYGDVSAIIKHYSSMKKWIDHNISVNMKDYILSNDRYGDWCMPPKHRELLHAVDSTLMTDGSILSTTVFYDLLQKMCVFARLSGHESDIPDYQQLLLKIKDAYNSKFFHRNNANYGNNTVTANLLSLRLGLVPQGYESNVFANILNLIENDFDTHISTGVVGIQHVMRGLTENGRVDLAYKIATNTTYPSWGYMVSKDATTIWELWNGDTASPGMNSHNHIMLLGDLIIWYFEDLAGIKCAPDAAGFKKIFMQPVFPKGLSSVNASYDSVYGTIRSDWSIKNDSFLWNVTIPGNTTAVIRIPSSFHVDKNLRTGMHKVFDDGSFTQFEVGSGSYQFVSN